MSIYKQIKDRLLYPSRDRCLKSSGHKSTRVDRLKQISQKLMYCDLCSMQNLIALHVFESLLSWFIAILCACCSEFTFRAEKIVWTGILYTSRASVYISHFTLNKLPVKTILTGNIKNHRNILHTFFLCYIPDKTLLLFIKRIILIFLHF